MDLIKLLKQDQNLNIRNLLSHYELDQVTSTLKKILNADNEELKTNVLYRLNVLSLLSSVLAYYEAQNVLSTKSNTPSPSRPPDESFLDEKSFKKLRELYELSNNSLS